LKSAIIGGKKIADVLDAKEHLTNRLDEKHAEAFIELAKALENGEGDNKMKRIINILLLCFCLLIVYNNTKAFANDNNLAKAMQQHERLENVNVSQILKKVNAEGAGADSTAAKCDAIRVALESTIGASVDAKAKTKIIKTFTSGVAYIVKGQEKSTSDSLLEYNLEAYVGEINDNIATLSNLAPLYEVFGETTVIEKGLKLKSDYVIVSKLMEGIDNSSYTLNSNYIMFPINITEMAKSKSNVYYIPKQKNHKPDIVVWNPKNVRIVTPYRNHPSYSAFIQHLNSTFSKCYELVKAKKGELAIDKYL